MLKTFKDARRRIVETVLEKTGNAERTVDEDYEVHVTKFHEMTADMNECGAELHSFMHHEKKMYEDARALAVSLGRIYSTSSDRSHWPNTNCKMKEFTAAGAFDEKWKLISEILLTSQASVLVDDALTPLKTNVQKIGPEIDALCKVRNNQAIDYDAHRRRLREVEKKRDSTAEPTEEQIADVVKWQGKVNNGKEMYAFHNDKAKTEIILAKQQHDELMDNLLITTVVCQAELFARAAKELQAVVDLLPQQKVSQVKSQLDDLITKGGVSFLQEEKSKLQKGIALATGKAVLSDFKKSDGSNTTSSSSPTNTSSSFTSNTKNNNRPPPPAVAVAQPVNPFDEPPTETASRAIVTSVSRPPPPPQNKTSFPKVKALFDHVAEDEDELAFVAGDIIEVIEKLDEGWWKGRVRGKEGLFPTNYVQEEL
eukprot:gene13936-18692_t